LEDLKNAIKVLQAYGKALEVALDRTVEYLPVATKQRIMGQAFKKLNTTAVEYITAVDVQLKGDVLLVEIDPDNWIANAVESGADPFNMKETHLNGPNTRISKKGFRYKIIPIGKDPNRKGPNTEKGQKYQKMVQDALKTPSFGRTFLNYLPNGKMAELQEVVSGNPMLSGFYRTRVYDNAQDMKSNKKKWSYVLFRVMSENPASISKWEHPGIKPQHFLKDTERWLHNNLTDVFEAFVAEEMDKFLK
jgi:hypothetical protein